MEKTLSKLQAILALTFIFVDFIALAYAHQDISAPIWRLALEVLLLGAIIVRWRSWEWD